MTAPCPAWCEWEGPHWHNEVTGFPVTKHEGFPCPTEGCPGDARYAPPGRGHLASCTYLQVGAG